MCVSVISLLVRSRIFNSNSVFFTNLVFKSYNWLTILGFFEFGSSITQFVHTYIMVNYSCGDIEDVDVSCTECADFFLCELKILFKCSVTCMILKKVLVSLHVMLQNQANDMSVYTQHVLIQIGRCDFKLV